MYFKVSGIWKEVKNGYTKVSGIWKVIIVGFQKIAGIWYNIFSTVPDSIIGFADGTAPIGTILCDGTNDTIDLIGKYFKVSSAQSSGDIGSNTHEHVYTGNSGYCSSSEYDDYDGSGRIMTRHYHTINHTHTATDHQPLYKELAPCILGTKIPTGVMLLFDETIIPDGWSEVVTHEGRFIKGGTSGLAAGADTHGHYYSGYTGYTDTGTPKSSSYVDRSEADNHRHSMTHTHADVSHVPPYYSMKLITPDSDAFIIPSGACAFFLGDIIPDGWSYFSAALDKFIRISTTIDSIGGVATHGHSYSGYSGNSTEPSIGTKNNDTYDTVAQTHNHSISHTHAAVNSEPLHRGLLFCKKD